MWSNKVLWRTDDPLEFDVEMWPRKNPSIGDKLMYKTPDTHGKEYENRPKLLNIDGYKEFEKQLEHIGNVIDNNIQKEIERRNKEYIMNYEEMFRKTTCTERIGYRDGLTVTINGKNYKIHSGKIEHEHGKYPVYTLTIDTHPLYIVNGGTAGSLDIKNVIFNPPATIVFWSDNTKTVVKTQNNEPFDPEKGLTMAICKKVYGNEGNYFNKIKKWTEPYIEAEGRVMNAVMERWMNMMSGTGLNMGKFGVPKKEEHPIIPLNKEICKFCLKGYPYGDCSHHECGCRNYDKFEPCFKNSFVEHDV